LIELAVRVAKSDKNLMLQNEESLFTTRKLFPEDSGVC